MHLFVEGVRMSVNRPDNQTLYQMAEAELRKLPQFKNSIAPIPTYLIKIKIDEFNRLKPEELQQKINEYFSSTENKPKGWAVFGLELSDKQNQNKPTQVTQYKSQNGKISPNDKNVREFAANLLLNNIINANEKLENYRNGFGYISSDAVYHGLSNIGDWTWDAFTGRDDFKGYHEKSNDLAKQKTMLQELTNLTSTKIEFEKKFKEIFGIDFDIEAFQNLQQASDDLNKLNTYEALSNRFKNSIDVINKNEGEFNFVSAMALVGPLFGNNMIKANEFVSNLEKDCSTDEEFKEKLIAVLSNAKNEADRNVAMISVKTPREHLEANYKQAYKNAMGDYHSSDDIDKFIEVSQRNTMYTEMAIIIASSTLTMGSSAVQGLGAKAVTKFGAKAGGHIFKAGMTAATASLSSVETVVSGLTSKDGLTSAKLSEAGEQLKSGLIFGAFGAYVSGPIGDKVVSLLKSNPNITSSIMQKVFSGVGFGTEITADALFELGLRGGDIETLFAENASGEALGRFMNMILGGRAHHASKALLDNISLKQDIDTDGKPKYSVIQDGKVVFETKDSNELVAGITSIAAEAQGLKIDDLDTKEQSAKQSTETIETTSQPLTRESVQEMKQSGRNVTTMPDGTVVEYINGKPVELGKVEESSYVRKIMNFTKNKAKSLILNNTTLGRDIRDGILYAKKSVETPFSSNKESIFDKAKNVVKQKINEDTQQIAKQLFGDPEFVRMFNSFVDKNFANKPELKDMILNYDLSGINDANLIKIIIESSGVGVTKIAQIISKDKSIMGKLEQSLPQDEFKNLQKALEECKSKCDFSRTIDEAQSELDNAFPYKDNSNLPIAKDALKGKYTILAENSAGSIGATYWALDPDGNKVVVKMLKKSADMEELGLEEKLFKKIVQAIASTPEDAHKYQVMVHNQYKDWYTELDFKQESIYNRKLTNGAKRYTVAQVKEVSADGTVLIIEKAQGIPMDMLVDMLKVFKEGSLSEYQTIYSDKIKEYPWLADPETILKDMPTTLLKTFDEQMLFMKKGGETVMHGDHLFS